VLPIRISLCQRRRELKPPPPSLRRSRPSTGVASPLSASHPLGWSEERRKKKQIANERRHGMHGMHGTETKKNEVKDERGEKEMKQKKEKRRKRKREEKKRKRKKNRKGIDRVKVKEEDHGCRK
jgi:hypothetical protein